MPYRRVLYRVSDFVLFKSDILWHMEKHSIRNPRVINRRNLLASAGSLATLGVMGHVAAQYQLEHEKEVVDDTVSNEETFEAYNELSDSGYFNEDVRQFAAEFALEVDEVLDNLDVYSTIQKNFSLPNIAHKQLSANLEALAPAIGFVE